MKKILFELFVILFFVLGMNCDGSSWDCKVVNKKQISVGIIYVEYNCSGKSEDKIIGKWEVGPINIHVVYSNLSIVSVYPLVAENNSTTKGLQTVPDMISNWNAKAAINGGYFWEVKNKDFFDDVCFFKSREDAEKNVSIDNPNYGIGDTLVRVNGTLKSCNCDLYGFSHPSAIILDGKNSHTKLLKRGEQLGPEYPNVIACGPNLVNWEDGKAVFGIPWDDFELNRWGHSSNTAVGLIGIPGNMETIAFVVTDGHDGCPLSNHTCGFEFFFFFSYFNFLD